MSVNSISSADPTKKFRNNVIGATVAGGALSGIYAATKKNYIKNGVPTDFFVKGVALRLSIKMKPKQFRESRMINNFLQKAVDPEVNVSDLIPLIHKSEELSEAVKATPEETVFDALKRIYSQSEDKIRKDLIDLQMKTKSNKKNSLSTAKEFIMKNYDPVTKKFVQSSDTTQGIFKMIKRTALSGQIKLVEAATIAGAVVAGALALIVCDYPDKKKS